MTHLRDGFQPQSGGAAEVGMRVPCEAGWPSPSAGWRGAAHRKLFDFGPPSVLEPYWRVLSAMVHVGKLTLGCMPEPCRTAGMHLQGRSAVAIQ